MRDKNIKMTRKELAKMRKSAGFQYKFKVTESKPYDHYKWLESLSKLQLRGEKTNENEKV